MTRTRAYVSVIPLEDGVFRATCPSIAGVHADGATPEEAEQNLLEMLETRIEHGPLGAREPVDLDPDEAVRTVEL
jgi:predicted RNase H-like HicB family nuclease